MSTVGFSAHGPGETVLDPEAPEALSALSEAGDDDAAVAGVAAHWPRCLAAWASLAEIAAGRGDSVESYAYARVGYHRGLDRLRQSGWRGSGYVRWRHETNRGFLRALDALRAAAAAIGEEDEAQRCAQFLHQLDPDQYRPA